jgi:Domain of unknown function (DUF4118)
VLKPREPLNRRTAWLAAVLAPIVAAALMVTLRAHTQPSNLALVMVVVVAGSVVPGYRGAALVAGLSAGLSFDFFLTQPYEQLSIRRSSDIQTTVLLTLAAVVVGEIAARRRKAHIQGRVARDEVMGLYVVAQMLSAGASPAAVIDAVGDQLQVLLFLTTCRFDWSLPADYDPLINRGGELEYGELGWSAGVDGLPNRDVSLPVESAGETIGRYRLRGPNVGVPLTPDRLLVAVALADLAGSALGAKGASSRLGEA